METSTPVRILLIQPELRRQPGSGVSQKNAIAGSHSVSEWSGFLKLPEYSLEIAESEGQAIESLVTGSFACVLLDRFGAEAESLESVRRICAADTPVIWLTSGQPTERQIEFGFEVGVVDWMPKAIDPRVLRSKLALLGDLFRKSQKSRDQEKRLLEVSDDRSSLREQTTTEEELRRSRDQLRIIFERVADGIVVHDLNLRVVYSNDVGAKLAGYPKAEDLIGRGVFDDLLDRFDIFDSEGNLLELHQLPTHIAIRGEHPAPGIVNRLRDRASGHERWLIVSSRPVLDEAGKPYLAVTIYRDITEQHRNEVSERFLADATAILASSLDYNATIGRVTQLAIDRITNWCKINLADDAGILKTISIQHSDPELCLVADASSRCYALDPQAATGSPYVFRTGKSILSSEITETDMREAAVNEDHLAKFRKLGLRSIMIVPIIGRDKILGTIGLASVGRRRRYDSTDLTLAQELGRRIGMAVENARLYLDVQAQRERLQKAVQARDEFISIAGHELKTPITSLILHAEMVALQLQRDESTDELRDRIRKYVTISTSQIDRLTRLVEEMLNVSRIASGKLTMEKEVLDLTKLVSGSVGDFSEQIRETGSSLHLETSQPIRVRCDRYRMEQVVANLLTNAMKYGESRPLHISVREEGEWGVFTVRDEGMGIASEHHRRIFERFERAISASEISGLGLGLYIVKNIVEAHGGEVSVESSLGKGATFIVRLPRIRD